MSPAGRASTFWSTYTRGISAEDLQRLFARDTRDAYRFFARRVDLSALDGLPRHRRVARHVRLLFLAFTMKLSPARRAVYGAALLFALIRMAELFRGFGTIPVGLRLPPPIDFLIGVPVPSPLFRTGTWWLVGGFLLLNLLMLLEVADRLSVKDDLEIAREIQQS